MTEEELRELEEQEAASNSSQGKTAFEKYDEVTSTIDDVRDMVNNIKEKKTTPSGTEVTSGASDVASTASNAVSNVGDVASKAGNTASTTASNVSEAAAKAQKASATATEQGAKASKAAAQGGKAASKGAQAGGKGMQAGGKGMQAAGNSPYTAGLKAAGAGVEGVGKGIEAGGRAGEAAATTAEAAATAAETTAKAQKAAADAQLAASEGAKAANAAVQSSKNGIKKPIDKTTADKIREKSKLNKWNNKRAEGKTKKFNPKNALNDFFEKFGEVGEGLKKVIGLFNPLTIVVIFFIFIIVGATLLYGVVSPMYYMDQIRSTADSVEKLDNYFSGLGFGDSKEAFYKEIDYLNTHYDNQLDYAYIMSALYYVDVFYNTDEYNKDSGKMGYQLMKYFIKESNSTIDENGLIYSSNKLYRLRELAKHQFDGNKEVVEASLSDYIVHCKEKLENELGNVIDCLPKLLLYIVGYNDPVLGGVVRGYEDSKAFTDLLNIVKGSEDWKSIEVYLNNGKYGFSEAKVILQNLLESFLGCFFDIKSVHLDAADIVKVEYYEYSFDQDAFEDYLVDHYIREMPEYASLVTDKNGKVDEDAVLRIAYEIKMAKDYYNELFKEKSSEDTNTTCIGDINLDLLSELTPPVGLTIGQNIKFSGTNNYGLYKGIMHHGVDLEASSTGTKQGDNVYSVYAGKVTESTVDGTFSDKSAKGGWVVIQYTVQYSDSTMGDSKLGKAFKDQHSTIFVYYGGLDPDTLKLKQGNIVKKGEVIGKVGSAAVSETGASPSLHFAVYDNKTSKFLNPINMFITCTKSTTVNKVCGVKNEQKIWTFLLSKGYTKEAAAGIMGVWKRESGFKPYIVQSKTDSYSKKYTKNVDKGIITRKKFAENGPGGGGYGLAQWTSKDRKYDLYDFANKKGKSVGDLEVQLEFFEKEINSGSYKNLKVKTKLNKATTVEETTKIFLRDYEGGGSSSLELRTKYAKAIYNEYKDYTCK